MAVGDAVKARREALGLSQRGLAKTAGVSGAFVSQIENGHRQPSLEALGRLGEALGTSPSALMAAAADDGESTEGLTAFVAASRSLADIEALIHDPPACLELVAAARQLAGSTRQEQLGAYMAVVTDFADMLDAFASRRYRAMTGSALIVIASAVSYVVEPEDAWPDSHPHGHLDDIGVLAFTRALVSEELIDFLAWQRGA